MAKLSGVRLWAHAKISRKRCSLPPKAKLRRPSKSNDWDRSTIFSTASREERSTVESCSISLQSRVPRNQPMQSHIRGTRSPEVLLGKVRRVIGNLQYRRAGASHSPAIVLTYRSLVKRFTRTVQRED